MAATTSHTHGFASARSFGRDPLTPTRRHARTHELAPEKYLEWKLRVALQRIVQQISLDKEHLEDALNALQALPLTSAEFTHAKGNLTNGQRYLRSREWGAARYELNSLLRRLPRLLPE